jgi:putative ABC transport system permease protein
VLSIAVTVSGIVALLFAQATLSAPQLGGTYSGPANPNAFDVGFVSRTQRIDQVLLIVAVMLATLAVVNVIFITRATALDNRHTSAVTRALGATPHQITAGLSAAQALPAVAGAILGIGGDLGLFAAANQGGGSVTPPAWWLIAVVLGTVLAVAGLTAIPARLDARRPAAQILQAETA